MAARTQRHTGPAVRRKRQPAGRSPRRHHPSRHPRSPERRRPRRRDGAGRAGGADLPVLGPADGLAGRRIRSCDPEERHQASVRRAVRAVQDLEAVAEADREARKRRGHARPHRDRRHARTPTPRALPCADRMASQSTRAPTSSAPKAAAAPCASNPASRSTASPGPNASSCSRRRSISRPTAATATAAISPTPARGAIASRCRPTARPDCGARSTRPTPRHRRRN